LSMTDAMGHTMDAALLATVLAGALRNARRRGVELAEQARLANDALAEQAGEGQFVTGLLVRIDLPRATAGIVNAGHSPPLRLRPGRVDHVLWRLTPRSACRPEAATGCKRCNWR
jgi:serine phosphatase RsbU (regulator of sigma subunit)